MFEFAGAMAEGGPAPSFGDADDGYVLDLGDSPRDVAALMRVGLLAIPGSKMAGAARHAETAYWVFGTDVARLDAAPPVHGTALPLASRAFADAGHYLLQWGNQGARDQVSVLFDCGELGFTALAAHGHADALSFTVRAFGVEMFVDPGTFDYFTYPEWRRYFRSTPAHNTVGIDGEDQSVLLGSFLWGTRANARCIDWQPRAGGGTVAGEHDGYTRLPDPVVCGRTLTLDQQTRTLRIVDRVSAKGRHQAVLYFHLSELCEVERHDSEIHIDCGEGRAILRIPAGLSIELHKGGSPEQGGWVSRGYHRKVPAWTVAARAETDGAAEFTTVLELSRSASRLISARVDQLYPRARLSDPASASKAARSFGDSAVFHLSSRRIARFRIEPHAVADHMMLPRAPVTRETGRLHSQKRVDAVERARRSTGTRLRS